MTDDSSPCQMDRADPAYMGFLPNDELVTALNELLEAERAGAAAVRLVGAALPDGMAGLRPQITLIGRDEGRFCRMLLSQVRRLGGTPSSETGAFVGKIAALNGFTDRMALLIKGQNWVVKRLDALLPRVRDDRLHAELTTMRDVHIENVALCRNLIEPGMR